MLMSSKTRDGLEDCYFANGLTDYYLTVLKLTPHRTLPWSHLQTKQPNNFKNDYDNIVAILGRWNLWLDGMNLLEETKFCQTLIRLRLLGAVS